MCPRRLKCFEMRAYVLSVYMLHWFASASLLSTHAKRGNVTFADMSNEHYVSFSTQS